MSYSLHIEADVGAATGLLDALSRAMVSREMNAAIGVSAATVFMRHFQALEAERSGHQMPGAATHFYEHVGDSVQYQEADDGVDIGIGNDETRGIRQRYYGGDIEPVFAQWLTIAARTEAYGHKAREFAFLKFVPLGPYTAMLVSVMDTEKEITKGKRAGQLRKLRMKRIDDSVVDANAIRVRETGTHGAGAVWYWLKKSVHQEPDPSVMPSDEVVYAAARGAVRDYVARLLHPEG